jgi:hypothetical protein
MLAFFVAFFAYLRMRRLTEIGNQLQALRKQQEHFLASGKNRTRFPA